MELETPIYTISERMRKKAKILAIVLVIVMIMVTIAPNGIVVKAQNVTKNSEVATNKEGGNPAIAGVSKSLAEAIKEKNASEEKEVICAGYTKAIAEIFNKAQERIAEKKAQEKKQEIARRKAAKKKKERKAAKEKAKRLSVWPSSNNKEEWDFINAVGMQEGGPNGAGCAIQAAYNRTKDSVWKAYGSTVIEQLIAPHQFEAYGSGAYTKYLNGNYPDSVRDGIKKVANGYIYHNYCSFREAGYAASAGISGVNICGNVYFQMIRQ